MKKITKILSLSVVVAGIVTPTVLIATSSNNINVDQGINSVDNNETNYIDGVLEHVEGNGQVKAVDDQFTVDGETLMAAGWGTDITGGLLFTIIKETDTEKNVSIQAQNTEEFAATNLSIKNTITNAGIVYNVTEIVGDGFNDCHGLTSVTISGGVTLIDFSAFANCVGLTSVTIDSGVETIAQSAFSGCKNLTGNLTIPASVTSIGDEAFYYGSHFTSIDIVSGNTKYCKATNLGENCDAVLEKTTGGTFGSDSKIVGGLIFGQLELPSTLTTIGENAFVGCSGLTHVVIPSSVTSIGYRAFGDCTGLTSVSIGDGVASIDSYAFCNCPLTTIDLTTNINFIKAGNLGDDCEVILPGDSGGNFSNSSSVVGNLACGKIDFTNSGMTSIGVMAFTQCAGITSVTIDSKVTSIGNESFYDCKRLVSVIIDNSVTAIGNDAFCNCIALTSVVIPNNLQIINRSVFNNCSSLTSITIPASVTSIGDSAFWNCSSLTSVTIPSSVITIGEDAFSSCSGLTTLDLTNATSLQTIGQYAFSGCSSLIGTLTIPASVTSIANQAFEYCYGLNGTLTIPASVTSIGNSAFNGNNFDDFSFLSETHPKTLGTNIFGIGVAKTLWVPSLTAQNDYSPYAATNFGLVNAECIKIIPTSIDISLTGDSPFIIDLNQAKETIITTATVTPNSADVTFREVTWSLVDSPNWLAIDAVGKITANEELKIISPGPYSFKINVVCKGAGQTFEKTTDVILINVTYPSITTITIDPIASANITLGEQANPNLRQCTAKIEPENYDPTKIKWSIIGDKPDWLSITPLTGIISTTQAITTAMPDSKDYTIQLEALDNPSLTATQPFTINFIKPVPTEITIDGVNTSQTVKVSETLTLNPTTTITPDYASTNVAWSLSSGSPLGMIIDPATGKITFAAAMEHANTTYNFDIIAKSTVAGSLIQGTCQVQLKVDYAIVTSVTVGDIETFDLKLGQDVANLVTCTATVNPNPGASQAVKWSIENERDWISIDQDSGTISVIGAIDESLLGNQTITVRATSQQDSIQSDTQDFTINFTRPTPPEPQPVEPSNDLNLGAIIGGSVGGAAGVAAIAGGTTYGVKRYKAKK